MKLILLNHRRKRNLRSSAHSLTASLRLHRTVPAIEASAFLTGFETMIEKVRKRRLQ